MRERHGPREQLGASAPGTDRSPSAVTAFRTKSTIDGTIPASRVFTGLQPHQPFHEAGHVTSERVARLCGDHLEHCYEAQRLTTHGTTCVSIAWHTEAPAAAANAAEHSPAHAAYGPPCNAAGQPNTVVCSTSTNSVAVFNTATAACVWQQTKGPRRCSNAFTPSLSHVAVYGDPMAPAIELQFLGKFAFLEGHTVEVRDVGLTPDSNTIISAGRGGQVYVWQIRDGQQQGQQQGGVSAASDLQVIRHALQGHSPSTQVKACCLSADGRWAATGGSDGKLLLWDLSALADTEAVAAAALAAASSAPKSPHRSSSCCVAGPPGLAKLAAEWQLGQAGREQVTCLSIAADGAVLAVGTRTGRVHVVLSCSSDSRQLLQLPSRHADGYKVRCVALSPDASKLLSTADDARMVLWDLSTRSCMLSIHEHTKLVRGCCWSSDGKRICSVGDDNLLIVHDIVILSSSTATTSGSKIRQAIRLDGLAAGTAAAAAAEEEAAGEGGQGSTVLRHPGLKRMDVTMLKERLLACVPLRAPSTRSSCNDSISKPERLASLAGRHASMPDGVLCADQSGQLLLLPPDSTAAVPTGMAVGNSIACCCFDGGIVAAAKREGNVTVMSCSPGASTPHSGVSATAGAGNGPAASAGLAGAAGVAPAAAGTWPAAAAAAPWDQHVAVSSKIDMVVLGISACRALGRVALAGVERKNTQTGVLHLWEFDPSVRPAALKAQGTTRGLSGLEPLTRQHSNRSGLSSRESIDSAPASPNFVSVDFDALQQGKGAAGGDGSVRWPQGREGPLSPSAASQAKARRGSNGGHGRLSLVDSVEDDTAGVSGAAAGASGGLAGSPQGWLWHCNNPVKVLTTQEAPLLCCTWTKGPDMPKLVVGSAAGWVVVVDCAGEDMDESMCRYQIHSGHVSALDCAADGATMVSGGADGHIVLWSHVTGFKLATFTLHSTAIKSLAFNFDGTLLAAGDADGIVSAWDVPQSCLLSAAQVHEGLVSDCCWSSRSSTCPAPSAIGPVSSTDGSSASRRELSLISCSYDGTLSVLQVDPSIYRQYSAAFCGLYYSCKKQNKMHKLEATLNWHLQNGALQDASVLQLLIMQAAADGNAAIMSLLLPMFEKMGWLLHFGPIFARPTLSSLPAALLRKTDSDAAAAANASRHERRRRTSAESTPQHSALHAYQPSLAASAVTPAAGSVIGLGLEDYVIHPHDRAKVTSSSGRGSNSPARRNTADRLLGERGHKRSGSYGDSADKGGFLEGSVISTPRNSRWTHSVADIKTMLAFSSAQPQQQQQASKDSGRQQQQALQQLRQQRQQQLQAPGGSVKAAANSLLMSTAGQSSFNGSSMLQGQDTSDTGSVTFASMGRSNSGGLDSDGSGGTGGMYSPSLGPDSPRSTNSPTMTPTRMLSPSVSRNARMAAQLPVLDTLHEESHSRAQSVDERGSGEATSRRSTISLAAAAAALTAGSASHRGTADSVPDSPRKDFTRFAQLSPRYDADLTTAGDPQASRGSDSVAPSVGTGYSPSPSPNAFLNHLLRSARGSQQQEGSPRGSDAAAGPAQGLALHRQGSGSNLPPLSPRQQVHAQDEQQPQRDSVARQMAALVSNRWLLRRRTAQDRAHSAAADLQEQYSCSAPLPMLSVIGAAALGPSPDGQNSSSDTSPAAMATVTTPGGVHDHLLVTLSSAEQGAGSTGADNSNSSQPPSKQNSARAFFTRLASSLSRMSSSRNATADAAPDPADIRAAANGMGMDANEFKSAFSAASANSRFDGLAASKRRLLANWASWRDANKSSARSRQQQAVQQQLLQRPPTVRKRLSGAATQRADLLQVAMASQQAQCVRLVVDALLEGRFSKVSVVLHMYEALQALIHDAQHKRTCRRLLKHLPMIDNGEVEVDSLLVHNTEVIYKCSAHGHTGKLWHDAISSRQALLDALDVLVKHSSWRDSIVALLMWPVLWSLRHLGASWLWLWARQGLRMRQRVQVSASSKLVPVAHAAEIRSSSRGNLLRQLLSANVDADLYGKELVRAVINVKWESFAKAFLLMQFVQFLAYFILFLAYMSVAVYGNDPSWTTSELIAHPQGRAALALECILMIMMFGQAADEAKQMVTYKQDYFNSPWNYFDCASIIIIAMLFLLHISRLNHELFIILVALELLLLCLRALYFCMAAEKVGALLRMVLIVIKDMRYFFLMLVFLLVSFGLTFSVLMSPISSDKLNLVSAVGSSTNGAVANSEVQVFGSLEDSVLQLFTIMFGDMQFSTLKTILSVNTVASRLAVFMAAIYAVLVLIVLVNLLIAIVDETYGVVKESEADQILRNKALIIDEIESTLTDAVIKDLNSRVLLPYVHILVPQAARADQQHRSRDLHAKLRKLKHFIKQSMQDQAAASAAATAAATTAAAAAAAASQKCHAASGSHMRNSGWGGAVSADGGPQPGSAAADAAAGAGAAAATSGAGDADAPSRPHQLRPNSLSGPSGWASLRRHSHTTLFRQSQDAEQQQGSTSGSTSAGMAQAAAGAAAVGTPTAAAAVAAVQPVDPAVLQLAADCLQRDLQEVSNTVGDLSQQVESVAATSSAAVAELSVKLDSLQSDVGQMKQLLMAILERQQ